MAHSANAGDLIAEFSAAPPKMGDIKKLAKGIKTNHALAEALWASGQFHARMLAVLILDKKRLDQAGIEAMAHDMMAHQDSERDHLSEWLMANQLMKAKPLVELLQSWEEHSIPILRRLFWYHQARLRWTGQPSPENTPVLVAKLEDKFATEDPMVQWTMNFCAAWIGVHQAEYRDRCIALGQKTGLYEELKAPKNCTPMYLPAFIEMEAAKRNL